MTNPPSPRRRWPRWLAGVLLIGVLSAVLEAAFIVVDGLHDRPGHADVALVLGNAVEADGRPSALLQSRLDRALEQYRHGDYPFIIVSGGFDVPGGDEATAMRAYLVGKGVPAERIIVDSQGVNTYASARFTARLLRERGWRSVCVVTDYYHVPRARLALRRFGVGTVYSVHSRDVERWNLYHLVREMAGMVKYALRSYDDPPGPDGRARG